MLEQQPEQFILSQEKKDLFPFHLPASLALINGETTKIHPIEFFLTLWKDSDVLERKVTCFRGGSRTAATSKMERFVIIVNGQKPLTIITKCSILEIRLWIIRSLDLTECVQNRLIKNFVVLCLRFSCQKSSAVYSVYEHIAGSVFL